MNILIAPALGVLGLIAAFVVFSLVMRYSDGTDQVKKIGDEIHKGAMKFMKTEYTYLLIFVAVLVVLVATFLTIQSAIAVVVGAACSSLAGFIGMYAATKANVRTATAAQQDGAAAALSVSFYGGSVMGLCVASLGLMPVISLPLNSMVPLVGFKYPVIIFTKTVLPAPFAPMMPIISPSLTEILISSAAIIPEKDF